MPNTNCKETTELLGIAAIVASLIFVGLQLRQGHQIALSESYQARAQMAVDVNLNAANTPEFTSAIAKLYSGQVEEITASERVVLEYQFGAMLTQFENHHYQFELGYFPAEHWAKNQRDMHCLFSLPLARDAVEYWEFRESFEEIVNSIIEDAIKNPSNCWD